MLRDVLTLGAVFGWITAWSLLMVGVAYAAGKGTES